MASKAEEIARKAHEGQKRFDGTPYIEHPKAVASMVRAFGADYEWAAWLHDVLEDSEITPLDFSRDSIPYHIIKAVQALTKKDDEPYEEYLKRVAQNKIAHRVKVADMLHNLSDSPSKNQVKRYAKGLIYLLGYGA